MLRTLLGILFVGIAVLSGCSSSSTTGGSNNANPDSGSIVGVWLPGGDLNSIEFTADGKVTMKDGSKVFSGTYKLEAGNLTLTIMKDGNVYDEIHTVKKVTATELIILHKGGKEETLKRKS